jgi:hypothetical protein
MISPNRPLHRPIGLAVVAVSTVLACVTASVGAASADTRTAGAAAEAEHVVPAQGGAYDVPLHTGAVCILSFPDKLSSRALTSSPDFDIRAWGDDGVAVRATDARAKPATLALATASGSVKVNVTLRVVPAATAALTLVRFKSTTRADAEEAAVASAVEAKTASLRDELARTRAEVDARIREGADRAIARRLLSRVETVAVSGHARNDDHVILHLREAVLLGDDGYLVFELENRGRAPYAVGAIAVLDAAGVDHGGAASLATATAAEADAIGTAPAGARTRGVVAIREIDELLGAELALAITRADGRGAITVDGIVLR